MFLFCCEQECVVFIYDKIQIQGIRQIKHFIRIMKIYIEFMQHLLPLLWIFSYKKKKLLKHLRVVPHFSNCCYASQLTWQSKKSKLLCSHCYGLWLVLMDFYTMLLYSYKTSLHRLNSFHRISPEHIISACYWFICSSALVIFIVLWSKLNFGWLLILLY